jgi:cytochrome c-type biogenesis protein CcmH
MKISIIFLLLLLFFSQLFAMTADEKLSDPALEARARAISQEVRCVVCQNQSIDDSDAPLARDLRLIVREQIMAGKSDEGVKNYLVNRYGTFVLLKPPFTKTTFFLWFGPILFAFIAGWGVLRYLRNHKLRGQELENTLSPEEQQRAAALIDRS